MLPLLKKYDDMKRLLVGAAVLKDLLKDGTMQSILALASSPVADPDTSSAPPEAREWAAAQIKAFVSEGMPAARLTEALDCGVRAFPECRCVATLLLHALASELRAVLPAQ